MYPAVIIPDGNAIMAIPTSEEIMLTKRPISDIGHISPYPTVVNVQVDQYNASKKFQTKDFVTKLSLINTMKGLEITKNLFSKKIFLQTMRKEKNLFFYH